MTECERLALVELRPRVAAVFGVYNLDDPPAVILASTGSACSKMSLNCPDVCGLLVFLKSVQTQRLLRAWPSLSPKPMTFTSLPSSNTPVECSHIFMTFTIIPAIYPESVVHQGLWLIAGQTQSICERNTALIARHNPVQQKSRC